MTKKSDQSREQCLAQINNTDCCETLVCNIAIIFKQNPQTVLILTKSVFLY